MATNMSLNLTPFGGQEATMEPFTPISNGPGLFVKAPTQVFSNSLDHELPVEPSDIYHGIERAYREPKIFKEPFVSRPIELDYNKMKPRCNEVGELWATHVPETGFPVKFSDLAELLKFIENKYEWSYVNHVNALMLRDLWEIINAGVEPTINIEPLPETLLSVLELLKNRSENVPAELFAVEPDTYMDSIRRINCTLELETILTPSMDLDEFDVRDRERNFITLAHKFGSSIQTYNARRLPVEFPLEDYQKEEFARLADPNVGFKELYYEYTEDEFGRFVGVFDVKHYVVAGYHFTRKAILTKIKNKYSHYPKVEDKNKVFNTIQACRIHPNIMVIWDKKDVRLCIENPDYFCENMIVDIVTIFRSYFTNGGFTLSPVDLLVSKLKGH